MAALESARFLHQDAFKRFTGGNRSLKYLGEYMEERARVEMDYSLGLEQLAARWNRKLADTLDFEYHDFRSVLRELFSEPTDKAPLHNRVANKIMNEAAVLKKQYKDHFKREAQNAILERYNEAMEKQTKLEEKTKKAKERYYRKKHALENIQRSMDEYPYRSESSTKYQELVQKRTDFSSQATDTYIRYESRLRVENLNRQEFAKDMEMCQNAYDEHEMYRLKSVRDRIKGMLEDLEILEGKEREPCQQKLTRLQTMVKDFPVKKAIDAYTSLFLKEHVFPKFEDYQSHSNERTEDGGTTERDLSLCGANSSREIVTGLSSTTHTGRDASSRRGVKSPTRGPVMAWAPNRSEESFDGEECDHDDGSDRNVADNEDVTTVSEGPDVAALTNVRVVAVRAYRGKQSTELSFDVGQVIKQKLPANDKGLAYGWIRPNNFSKRRYGTYPADCVKVKPRKNTK